ncbi:hypothetical protein F5876DRAFT_68348 [Lentinula aff. lateritia]|uniref:Uncharacterized protein n=1 Tax=Lentinula aff. lateritia TaxID=2804960 RepID=A0ACC1TR01_9AGAR|nr:hypothetical protein F5876DRAFT_68348 [Lentinula aff. lateritia]
MKGFHLACHGPFFLDIISARENRLTALALIPMVCGLGTIVYTVTEISCGIAELNSGMDWKRFLPGKSTERGWGLAKLQRLFKIDEVVVTKIILVSNPVSINMLKAVAQARMVQQCIEALVKVVAGEWGNPNVVNQQFKFDNPPKRFAEYFPPSTRRFELLGGMKGCEREVDDKWPCVGYIYGINPVEGDLTSLIRMETYDTMKLNHLQKWEGSAPRR